jgi:hypothetical protein
MIRHSCVFVMVSMVFTLVFVGVVGAQQFPVLDEIADKVVQKYQQSSCEQLWQQKGQPKTPMEEQAVQTLRANPAMRDEFFRRVAVPIVTKMFECGMIP